MSESIRLGVYRRLDNRFEGLPDDSPRALELHERRRLALHEALDKQPDLRVMEWGQTDDEEPHEFVELVVAILATPAATAVAKSAFDWLTDQIKDAVGGVVVDGVKGLIKRLLPQQKRQRILDFNVTLPNGTVVTVYPHDDHSEIRLSTTGDSVTIQFDEVP